MDVTPIIETRDLTKIYKKKVVLDKVNITVNQGDIYGFVGKNGAGKTTLIRILSNLVFPSSGAYKLKGTSDPSKLRQIQRRVASMVETPALYLDMSATDNIRSRCFLLGIKATPELIAKTLENVGLSEVIEVHKKVKDFSLGMKQRLGIAMSLMGDPEILLLDEPINGLDPEGIREVRELLLKINKEQNITILISSHILTELSRLATRFAFIDEGKIIREISAEELTSLEGKSLSIYCKEPQKVAQLIMKKYPEYIATADTKKVTINHVSNTMEVIDYLREKKVEILDFSSSENNLEDYFVQLLNEGETNG